jgi:hypothetical protein
VAYRAGKQRQGSEAAGGVAVKETFETESQNAPDLQRQGWQAILDNFGQYVEAQR